VLTVSGDKPRLELSIAPAATPRRPVVEIYVYSEGAPNAYSDELATLDIGEALARADVCDHDVDFQRISVWGPHYVGCWTRSRPNVAIGVVIDRPWNKWMWATNASVIEADDPRVLLTLSRYDRLLGAAERIMDLAKLEPLEPIPDRTEPTVRVVS
jgi:hypothetical protein